MLLVLGWLLIALAVTVAHAQQPQPQQSPGEQALGQKLMQEIQSGVQCSMQSISLQRELATVQAEVKRLAEKYEAKKDEPKK